MQDFDKYREILKDTDSIDSYDSADEVVESYHKLQDLKQEDLDNFLFEYARVGIKNEYLKYVFDNHLLSCDYCIQKLKRYKYIFEVIDEYGEEGVAIVKAKEFIKKAEAYKREGNYTEAIQCLQEALELRIEDEEIKQKIEKIKKEIERKNLEEQKTTEAFKDRFKTLIKKIDNLKRGVSLISRVISNIDRTGAPILGALEIDESKKNIFKIDENIDISIEMPFNRDGYLTVFYYDDFNIKMIFPNKAIDLNLFRADEVKFIKIKADKPIGKKFVKAFWTSQQLIRPEDVRFQDAANLTSIIEDFIKTITSLNNNEWMESVIEFEVKK